MSLIYQPAAALLAWTMIMWLWMYTTRIPAMRKAKVDIAKAVGTTGGSLDAILPPEIQWKAHNYNHLMAEPTIFYATVILLGLTGGDDLWAMNLAWAYVGLRIAHSIFQATVNRVMVRFLLFALSSLCLTGLVLRLLVAVFCA